MAAKLLASEPEAEVSEPGAEPREAGSVWRMRLAGAEVSEASCSDRRVEGLSLLIWVEAWKPGERMGMPASSGPCKVGESVMVLIVEPEEWTRERLLPL